MRLSPYSLAASLLLAVSTVFAQGVVIVQTQKPLQGPGEPSTTKVNIEGDKLFIHTDRGDHQQGVIFLGDEKVMRILDYSHNTYREMTEQDFQRMSGQLGDAMAQQRKMMEEKLKDLPPQQREMVERMLKQRTGGAAAPPIELKATPTVYTKVASGQHVGRWTCDKYEGTQDGRKTSEICAVDFAQLGVRLDDLRVFQQMAEMFKNMVPEGLVNLPQFAGGNAANRPAFEGFPVQRISFNNGTATSESDVTDVIRQDIDDALFEPPPGFTKAVMPNLHAPER